MCVKIQLYITLHPNYKLTFAYLNIKKKPTKYK